jgi:5-methylcytosine-specific restriction endonuclease McrA
VAIPEAMERRARRRAQGRCEYCQLPESAYPVPFQGDHIIAIQHGGKTRLGNIAWACPWCNRSKGPNLAGYDYRTRRVVPLYHPRRDRWDEHFRWHGPRLVGLTATGRATIRALNINRLAAVELRRELMAEDRFPPIDFHDEPGR